MSGPPAPTAAGLYEVRGGISYKIILLYGLWSLFSKWDVQFRVVIESIVRLYE